MIDSIKQLLQQEAQAVLNIPVTDAYEKAVQLIVEQIHQKKGKLVTSGMGKAGQIAMNIATTFCSTGIPSVFLHPSEAQHGDLGILQKNDLLLLISNSGKTREIVELTRLAHNLDPELKFIVITGNPDSPLANESNVCLSTGKPAEVCTLGMTPTTSTTAMTVIGDILVVQTMKKKDSPSKNTQNATTVVIWAKNQDHYAKSNRYRRNNPRYHLSGKPAFRSRTGRLCIQRHRIPRTNGDQGRFYQ